MTITKYSLPHKLFVGVSNLAPISKFVCARSRFQMVLSVGARFILVQAECPYIQSLVARATGTIIVNAHSRGYKRVREGRRAHKSLMHGYT